MVKAANQSNESGLKKIGSFLLIFILLAILPLAFIYINYSAWNTWRESTYLETNGALVTGTIVDREHTSGPRTADSYYLTYDYDVDSVRYQTRKQVDQATYTLHDIGDDANILYDESNPRTSDVVYNDYKSITAFIVIFFDVVVVATMYFVYRRAKKEQPPVED